MFTNVYHDSAAHLCSLGDSDRLTGRLHSAFFAVDQYGWQWSGDNTPACGVSDQIKSNQIKFIEQQRARGASYRLLKH